MTNHIIVIVLVADIACSSSHPYVALLLHDSVIRENMNVWSSVVLGECRLGDSHCPYGARNSRESSGEV